jgi:hypothetical protein
MPCDTVRTVEVGSLEAADKALLVKALEALGYVHNPRYQRWEHTNGLTVSDSGKVTASYGTDASEHVAAIKRGYSREVVSHVAKKYGWAKVDRSNGRLILTKR